MEHILDKLCDIDCDTYQAASPYSHIFIDGFLDEDLAHEVQKEILSIPSDDFDRYNNPFEQKYTLRDKYNYPPKLKELMNLLTSEHVVEKLSEICGQKLHNDPTRNFWGVHIYEPGDYLDIHVDAGLHPETLDKKQLTLGIYLSYDWDQEYGCDLEVWKGDSAASERPALKYCVTKIPPIFNRMVLFTCDDYSWHGNPEPSIAPANARRIFVTLSYLSKNTIDQNKLRKALFIARPSDPVDHEKDHLRRLRSDANKYKEIYNISK